MLATNLIQASPTGIAVEIVSLEADWFQNGQQGSPTRPLPNASLSLSEAADRLGGWQHRSSGVVRSNPRADCIRNGYDHTLAAAIRQELRA